MKKQLSATITFACVCIFSLSSLGQQKSSVRYSVGPDLGIPTGKLSDNYKWSLGGSIQADIPILKEELFVTANAGYINIFADNDISLVKDIQLLPVKVGVKYFPISGLYLQGEAGVSFILKEHALADKSASFVYAPQIGYLIPVAKGSSIDAGVRFEGNSKFYKGGKSNNLIALRVAYAFSFGKI